MLSISLTTSSFKPFHPSFTSPLVCVSLRQLHVLCLLGITLCLCCHAVTSRSSFLFVSSLPLFCNSQLPLSFHPAVSVSWSPNFYVCSVSSLCPTLHSAPPSVYSLIILFILLFRGYLSSLRDNSLSIVVSPPWTKAHYSVFCIYVLFQ